MVVNAILGGSFFQSMGSSSALRIFAYEYLHFIARHFDSLITSGYYETAVIMIVLLICGALAWLAHSTRARFLSMPAIYSVTLVMAIVWARLPWIVAGQLNVDEGMLLAGARRLVYDPVFWRSVDGCTSGPLNYYSLLLPRLLGLPFDFATTHLMNALCFGSVLVLLYLCARLLLPEAAARLSVLPVLVAVMSFRIGDFIHYTSECVSIFLIALATWLLISAYIEPVSQTWNWKLIAIGVITCLLPLAKLQSVPVALVIGGGGLALASSRKGVPAFLAGVGGVLLIFFVFLAAFGQLAEFFRTYIEYNFRYANSSLVTPWTLTTFTNFLIGTQEIKVLLLTILAYLAFCAVMPAIGRAAGSAVGWIFSGVLMAASVYCTYRSMRGFWHYQLFLIFPIGLLFVIALASRMARPRHAPIAVFLVMTVAAPLYWNAGMGKGDMQALLAIPRFVECRACDVIARFAKPGDLVSVWGWAPELNVLTDTVHASRESFTERQVIPSLQIAFYQQRFVDDLKRHTPVVFVDAVGPGRFAMYDRQRYAHETCPNLEVFVQSNFDLIEDTEGCRFFVRKDLHAKLDGH